MSGMKKPFLLFEDNGDGTITSTIYMGGDIEEQSFVMPMDFQDLIALSLNPPDMSVAEAQHMMEDYMIDIPNKPPEESD
jgi:hypothetical protein